MSLYNISEELIEIFAEIEENEGEITPELAAKLDITEDNLYDKLDNYVKAINSWKGDVINVETEVKRLNTNKKVKENKIERLKLAMLNAVLIFGKQGKTNKSIDLPTVKLFTKGTPSVETDDNRIALLVNEFTRFVTEIVSSGVLYTGSDVELQGILDVINSNLKAEHDSHDIDTLGLEGVKVYTPYTLADLTTLKIQITTTQTIYDLFRNGKDALNSVGKNPFNTKVTSVTPKDDWKTAIAVADSMNGGEEQVYSYPTVAKVKVNQSIQIR